MSQDPSPALGVLEKSALHADSHAPDNELCLLDDPEEWSSFGKRVQLPGQGKTDLQCWDSQIALEGMYCSTCALTIEDALRAVPGVEQVEVSAAARRARVVWRPDIVKPSAWMAAVSRAGYRAFPARDAQARELRVAQHRKALWRWLLAALCMMQVMMYAWPAYEAQPGDLFMEYERLLRWASWVICIPMLIFACGPFFSGAWRDLRHRRVSMELPVALGILITFLVSTIGTFDPEGIFGQEVFYDSLTMFVCFLLTGRWLEIRLRERTVGALDAVLNRLPESIERLGADGRYERVALRRIQAGDVLRVLPGEAFPADGLILQGHTQVDEALLTGESRPVTRSAGDTVIAGSHNLSAAVQMRVERLGEDTRFAQIVALMESASTQKPRLAQLADKVAAPFLVIVLLLAAGAAMYWWRTDPGQALMIAAAVLIVTCPCALSLATPVALLTAAGTLARCGVLVRNLQGIESLAGVDTLVFDKTGTLTRDGLQVAGMQVQSEAQQLACKGLAAAVAAQSRHPVSRAVHAYGQAWVSRWQVLACEEISGQGLRATVQELGEVGADACWTVRLGSARFAAAARSGFPSAAQSVYLARELHDGTVSELAMFELHEGVRSEAASVVSALQQSGIDVQLLSGDSVSAVQHIASQVGIAHYVSECSPQAKLGAVRQAQTLGRKVAMVGDGLNDGPVLAGADVSFAFGKAVPLAQAKADFVVLSDNLEFVQKTVMLSRKTMRVVRQNLLGSALYNGICIPLAMAGWMPAWLAGLGMALSSLLVVLNAARLARPLKLELSSVSTVVPQAQRSVAVAA